MGAMDQETFKQVMAMIAEENAKMLRTVLAEVSLTKPSANLVDTRGIGKPPAFKGAQEKYPEWMAKLLAYLRAVQGESDEWIKDAMGYMGPIANDIVEVHFKGEGK